SFCTLEEAVVRMRMPDGVTTWRRQYPIPYHYEQFIDQAIEKWLKDGTVVRLKTCSSFNTPLILVPKKDAQGKRTDFRPCLDFRHLNVLLEDEKFELPLIKNIFRSLAGS
ncbi:MAG: hypothetical protein J3R72DRAFT_352937, partial [Linnemannia gamsii]